MATHRTDSRLENPHSKSDDPEKAIAFEQGVVATIVHLGKIARSGALGDELLLVMPPNLLKQIAVDHAFDAIDIAQMAGHAPGSPIHQIGEQLVGETDSILAPDA